MRRIFITALIFLCCISTFSGCSSSEYYTDVNEYSKIWELSGFMYKQNEKDILFPNNIDDLSVIEFFCRYDEQLPLGEGIQVYLEVQYDQEAFSDEVQRISSQGAECTSFFDENNIKFAFASSLGEGYYYDYALIDQSQYMIQYVYLQSLKENEIEFPHNLLPSNYTPYGFEKTVVN